MKINPVGKFREKTINKKSSNPNKKHKDYADYDSYLVAECLERKLKPEEYSKHNLSLNDGDEVWIFNDNKVPLCGELGILVIRNGLLLKKIHLGMH